MSDAQSELERIFDRKAANAISAFMQEKGLKSVDELKGYLKSPDGDGGYIHIIDLLRVPRLGRKTTERVWRWAHPLRYEALDTAKAEIKQLRSIGATKEQMKPWRDKLESLRWITYP